MTKSWSPNNLKVLVEESGMTMEQIAEDANIGKSTLSKILANTYCPSIDILISLADYFAVPLDYLVGRVTKEECDAIEESFKNNFYILRKNTYEESIGSKKLKWFDPIPEGYTAPWPYNLLNDIFEEKLKVVLSDDQYAGLEKALSSLNDRMKDILLSIYRDEMTLIDLSRKYHITHERVRQIRERAIRRLRAPYFKALISDGLEGSKAIEQELFYISHKRQELLEARTGLRKLEELDDDNVQYQKQYVMPFYEVLDWHLSVRTTNCLMRTGIKTIADIQKAFQNGAILRIRNFGRVSYNELCMYMLKAGYEIPEGENE